MKFHVVAIDYDGTLTANGVVDPRTVEALHQTRRSGRRLVLVTGRLLTSLLDAFPLINVFDRVVAENGAILYNPETRERQLLAEPPPSEFLDRLRLKMVPIDEVGEVVTVTHVPHEAGVLGAIKDLGLELQIVFNKGAVMVLPSGVNKATGLKAALTDLGLSPRSAVGIGDAENDEAFLKLCEASIAVSNAIDSIKGLADVTLRRAAGAGVIDLVANLVDNDLVTLHQGHRRSFTLGTDERGDPVRVPVYGTRMLLTGNSASGKSQLAVGVLQQLLEAQYQTCVVDPEGDFQTLDDVVILGTRERPPEPDEVVQVVKPFDKSFVLSLFAAKTSEQPLLFSKLVRVLHDCRVQSGRPHWHIVDEAHYPVSAAWAPIHELHLADWRSVMYVTAHFSQMPDSVLKSIELFVAMGERPHDLLAEFCTKVEATCPRIPAPTELEGRCGIAWWRNFGEPIWFRPLPPQGVHKRHQHQYFDGNMDAADRFYFRGPENTLNLPVSNLRSFAEVARGVDDETWMYHLLRGDYAGWFRAKIQDHALAEITERVQRTRELSPLESREAIVTAIHQLYAKEFGATQ